MAKRTGRHPVNALTDLGIKRLKEPGFYSDGGCLHLRVDEHGFKTWVLRIVASGKRKTMGLGSYSPANGIAIARQRAARYRQIAKEGKNPLDYWVVREPTAAKPDEGWSIVRRDEVRAQKKIPTFEEIARELHESMSPGWRDAKHAAEWLSTLEQYAFPMIGTRLVNTIDTDDVKLVLTQAIGKQGEQFWLAKSPTASRVRQRIETVLDRAKVQEKRTGDNPARWQGHFEHLLASPSKVHTVEHHPAMDWRELPDFMQQLAKRNGTAARALGFAILTLPRIGKVLNMRWREVDLPDGVWTIPGRGKGGGEDHRIPLTPAGIYSMGAPGKADALVFPGRKGKPLRDMAIRSLLKRMGHVGHDHVTPHGFRSTFRDWAGETTNHPREVIEAALGHKLKDKAEAAYARGDLFQKRRVLMQDWSNYATGSKGTVTVLRQPAALHA